MFGQMRRPGSPAAMPTNDPNELLQRIDQRSLQMFHWIRAGIVVIILLLVLVVLIG